MMDKSDRSNIYLSIIDISIIILSIVVVIMERLYRQMVDNVQLNDLANDSVSQSAVRQHLFLELRAPKNV